MLSLLSLEACICRLRLMAKGVLLHRRSQSRLGPHRDLATQKGAVDRDLHDTSSYGKEWITRDDRGLYIDKMPVRSGMISVSRQTRTMGDTVPVQR